MTSCSFLKRGSVTIMTGLLAIPLVAMTGVAIDLARVWLVRSRLQVSLDAAVLVVARDLATGGTSADGLNLFWANFGRASAHQNRVHGHHRDGSDRAQSGARRRDRQRAVDQLRHRRPDAARHHGHRSHHGQWRIHRAECRIRAGTVAGARQHRLDGRIINHVVDLGIESAAEHSLRRQRYPATLWVSVVPFAATVNVGNTHTGWLVGGTINQAPYSPSHWMGCVMARTAATGAQDGDDFNDKTPAQASFKPFLWASTYHVYPTAAGIRYGTGNKLTYWYPGDNDWTVSPNNIQEPDQSNNSVGPNLGCPSLAILPETASKAAVTAVINQMVPVYRGGTIISLGLQSGWWTLSPNWRGLWGDPSMPLAYNTPYMKKVIVLMTDGNNEWYDWPDGVPGQRPPTAPPTGVPAWTADGDADFTAYGRLKTNTRGVASAPSRPRSTRGCRRCARPSSRTASSSTRSCSTTTRRRPRHCSGIAPPLPATTS
jgi:Flp pilus assembly protein TadG